MEEQLVYRSYFSSPVGWIELCATVKGLCSLYFTRGKSKPERASALLKEAERQVRGYFDKTRTVFSVPLDLQGTEFQKKVWNELLNIPFGNTISYLQLARRLGDEKVIRAAGRANGSNPVSIIVPCHRVIGSDGTLVGYGGGLDKKKWLLGFEGALKQKELFA
ncbi:MAG: methylated-DNA--[protein]-cysteine S-methyltransferase [Bacteroidota bacterium]